MRVGRWVGVVVVAVMCAAAAGCGSHAASWYSRLRVVWRSADPLAPNPTLVTVVGRYAYLEGTDYIVDVQRGLLGTDQVMLHRLTDGLAVLNFAGVGADASLIAPEPSAGVVMFMVNQRLVGADVHVGAERWRVNLGPYSQGPLPGQGAAYVFRIDPPAVVQIDARTGARRPVGRYDEYRTTFLGGPASAPVFSDGGSVYRVDAATGRTIERRDGIAFVAPDTVIDVAPHPSEGCPPTTVSGVSLRTGRRLWSRPGAAPEGTHCGARATPIPGSQVVWVREADDQGARASAVYSPTGGWSWRLPAGEIPQGQDGRYLVLRSATGVDVRETRTGREIDRLRFGVQHAGARRRPGVLVALTISGFPGDVDVPLDPRIAALDPSSGRIEWISPSLSPAEPLPQEAGLIVEPPSLVAIVPDDPANPVVGDSVITIADNKLVRLSGP